MQDYRTYTSPVTKITENKYWNISQILLGFTKIPLIWESPVQFGIFLYENCKTFCLAEVQILFNNRLLPGKSSEFTLNRAFSVKFKK